MASDKNWSSFNQSEDSSEVPFCHRLNGENYVSHLFFFFFFDLLLEFPFTKVRGIHKYHQILTEKFHMLGATHALGENSLKFMFSEKATKFEKIFTVDLTLCYVVSVKSKVKIL